MASRTTSGNQNAWKNPIQAAMPSLGTNPAFNPSRKKEEQADAAEQRQDELQYLNRYD